MEGVVDSMQYYIALSAKVVIQSVPIVFDPDSRLNSKMQGEL